MYDLIIIGSGPAGYVAAERAGEAGLKTLLVEEAEHLGGVCLNSGCIPTKSMLHCSHLYAHTREGSAFGVHAKDVTFDYPAVKERTEGIQDKLRGGIRALMKKNKVEILAGRGRLAARNRVEVDAEAFEAKNILLCTGSRAFVPPIPGIEQDHVLTHVEILQEEAMAEKLVIIGGGVIGLEFADVYASAGREVTVIEMLPRLAGATDTELAKTVQKALQKKGVTFHLEARCDAIEADGVRVTDRNGNGERVEADRVLVATGRKPNVEDLGLDAAGVETSGRGIVVDEQARTNVPGIYAAGDVTGRWMLAHFASRQATVAVNSIAGRPDRCREDAVPTVIYTAPEIASVGLTEEIAAERGLTVRTKKFPLSNNGRYLAETDGERGVCKVVVGAEHGEVLGVHMVGPHVSEMVASAAVLIETELREADVAELIYPHPTISEAMRDAIAG
jgi:dihydrolipoamide dehydrogenase